MNEAPPSVTIVGAGIAGMSAALRLLKAGCPVTVIEKTGDVGGQFGGVEDDRGRYHEHAFHIFARWCENFRAICQEIGLKPIPERDVDVRDLTRVDSDFDPRPAFLTLRPYDPQRGHAGGQSRRSYPVSKGRATGDFSRLEYLGSPEHFWKNANAGVAHWSDMLIYQYSILDLLSDDTFEDEEGKEFLNRVSVNGFMRSREYASDLAAVLHHELLLKVFAVPSYRTSARTYQTYLRHTAAYLDPWPSFWSLKGNVRDHFWKPFLEEFDRRQEQRYELGQEKDPYRRESKLRLNQEVMAVEIAAEAGKRRATRIKIGGEWEGVDGHLLLALPPAGLKAILLNSPGLAAAVPELLDVAYLEAVPVAAINLYFNKRLDFPPEHVTLLDSPDEFYHPDPSLARKNGIASEFGLSLVDHSRLWPELGADRTVLSVLAADVRSLLGEKEPTIKRRIVNTLQKYVGFDEKDFDDFDRDVHLQTHEQQPLFINSDGSWQYRPEARLDESSRRFPRVQDKVSNLFLAGDYCRSTVDMVSVEAAIVTGICAARLMCDKVDGPKPIPPFDRDRIRRAKELLDPWIDLATRRAQRDFLDNRKRWTAMPSRR